MGAERMSWRPGNYGMTEDRLVLLIARRMTGDLASEEERELEMWMQKEPKNRELLDHLMDDEALEDELDQWRSFDPVVGHTKWIRKQSRLRERVLLIGACALAAVIVLFITAGALIRNVHQPATRVTRKAPDVLPGRNTATLILSDGQRILLDSAGRGELATQGDTHLVILNDGHISYVADGKGGRVSAAYNLLETPRAGQYQLTLSDGSHVWLNNVSSLRYPTCFRGNDRTVELTGEAFFEIEPDPARPFVVKVKDEVVEVLGTTFDIMAYPEEGGTQTTLVTGAVRIRAGASTVQLAADQQCKVGAGGKLEVVNDVPSEDIVAWKKGFFYFGHASFEAVMRQLARWYDVDVVYEGKVPDINFGGKIDRGLPLEDVLKFLDKNQIHFRLDGRKLIVLAN